MNQVALYALSAILIALAAFVWRARPDNAINRLFAGYTVLMAAWIVGIGGLAGGARLNAWGRFTFCSASLMPPAFLAFVRRYPSTGAWPSAKVTRILFIVGVGFAVLSLATPLIVADAYLTHNGLARKTGPLYPAFAAYFLTGWLLALLVLATQWKRAAGLGRAQLQYLGAGLVFPVAGGIVTNLLLPLITGRSTYSNIGPYFTLPLVLIIGHAVIRHRLLDLRPVIRRAVAYLIVATAISVIVVAAIPLLHSGTAIDISRLGPHTIIAVIVILFVFTSPVQQLLRAAIDPYLFRGHLDHGAVLREGTRRLSRLMQPAELARELQTLVAATLVPESFSMFVIPAAGTALELLFADNQSAKADDSRLQDALITLARTRTSPSVVLVDPTFQGQALRTLHHSVRSVSIEVVISLGRRGHLLGIICLGPRRSGEAYFKKDLELLESLAELGSIALENGTLYRQRIQMLEYSDRLLESLDAAVVAVDASGRITSLNPAAKVLLGLTDPQQGGRLDDLPTQVSWAVALAIGGAWAPTGVEATVEAPARGIVPILLSTAVLHDEHARVVGGLAIVTDLSAVKNLERHQRRAEHLATMARFYAGVAHEIRNPLASISNLIEMLPDRFDDPEYRETASRLVPMEIARIVRLADRLRLMAPSEGGKLSPVGLPSLLNDILAIHSPAASEKRVRIALNCAHDLPRISADPGQLIQLFVNLLKNAIEAMPEGGNLTIEAFAAGEREGYVIVRVVDEGTGVSPSIREKVFQPFFTTKPNGSGLGLSICREIADFHKARLFLLPRTNACGTVAQVEFPCLIESKPPSMSTDSIPQSVR